MSLTLQMFKNIVADICNAGEEVSDADLEQLARVVHGEQSSRVLRKKVVGPIECPKCGNSLKRRKSKHGEFLGCSMFPACRYSRDVPPVTSFDDPLCGVRLDEFSLKDGKLYRERGSAEIEVDRAPGSLVKIGTKFYSVEAIVTKLQSLSK
jgi:ssDNA-binding Zn-finger/Zn-ribbon topoisomerase 1